MWCWGRTRLSVRFAALCGDDTVRCQVKLKARGARRNVRPMIQSGRSSRFALRQVGCRAAMGWNLASRAWPSGASRVTGGAPCA